MPIKVNVLKELETPGILICGLDLNFDRPLKGQISRFIKNNNNVFNGCLHLVSINHSVATIALIAGLGEKSCLPNIAIHNWPTCKKIDWFESANYCCEIVDEKFPDKKADSGFIVLAGLKLSDSELSQIADKLEVQKKELRVFDVVIDNFDPKNPKSGVLDKITNCGLMMEDVANSENIVYCPPTVGFSGILMALTIFGLIRAWPKMANFNREDKNNPNLIEIIDYN